MKKVEEKKQLTMKDLEELYEKHISATGEEAKELWKNELEFNKKILGCLRDTRRSCYKIITDKLIVDDIWPREVNELNYALKTYDIKEFVFKDTSTAAMEILIKFLELGWEVVGTEDWGLDERFEYKDGDSKRYYEPMQGIVLRRKEN